MHRWLSLVVAVLWASPAHATFVDFTSVTFAPSQTLFIDGVTVTGMKDGVLVATELGQGLGIAGGIGLDSSIDGIFGWNNNGNREGELRLVVDGTINALTLMPFLYIDGPQPAELPNFELSVNPASATGSINFGRQYRVVTPFVPFTYDFTIYFAQPTSIGHVGLFTDYGEDRYFWDYEAMFPDDTGTTTIHYGYSIVSLDYTPHSVPEPTTLVLMAFGLAGVGISSSRRH